MSAITVTGTRLSLRLKASLTIGVILAVFVLFSSAVYASTPISTGDTKISNDYPDSVTFEIDAYSTAGTIVDVAINLVIRGGGAIRTEPAELEPGQQVTASYVWKTRRDGIPPGSLVEASWTVRDDAGNKLTTESDTYVVLDARFQWQVLENDDVVLWWYDGDEEFGQRVFDSAARSLAALKENTGQALPYRIHVVIYANDDDFDSWHSYAREWVAGEAFPRQGLTVQIIPPGSARATLWHIEAMMPHELAHLFFYQVTNTSFAMSPPTWLNEGFSQYHEFLSNDEELAWVRRLARRGELIPLRLLSGTFTGDDERISLMYAESLSAVVFLFDQWGKEGMGTLLAAYQSGLDTDEALHKATGLTFEEFQEAWWDWLGGQPGEYPTRVPTPQMPTPEPVWTLASPPTSIPDETATPSMPQPAAPTSPASPTKLVQVTIAPSKVPPSPSAPTATPFPDSAERSTCFGPFVLAGITISLPIAARCRRRQQGGNSLD